MPTAGEVMSMSRALLNDVNATVFTNTAQLPYLNIAIRDLSQKLELNNIPVSNETSAVILVAADGDNIGGPDIGDPALPEGLIEIQQLWQRQTGTNNPFLPITRYEFLPHYLQNDDQINNWIPAWAWINQIIKLIPANVDTDVKIDFVKNIISEATDPDDEISVYNSLNYLGFRTAALCANFIGENPQRAELLDGQAALAFSEVLGISNKGRQSITTRRRPFRAAFKNRGIW